MLMVLSRMLEKYYESSEQWVNELGKLNQMMLLQPMNVSRRGWLEQTEKLVFISQLTVRQCLYTRTTGILISPKFTQMSMYNQIRSNLVEFFPGISKSPEDTATALLQFDNEFRNKTLGTFQKPVIQLTASQHLHGCSSMVGELWK